MKMLREDLVDLLRASKEMAEGVCVCLCEQCEFICNSSTLYQNTIYTNTTKV